MPRARFPRGRSGQRSRRVSTWVAPADQDTVSVASGASVIVASFDASGNGMLAPTIVRSRGEVAVRNTAFGADVVIGGAFGICVVSDEAFAAGTASIPRPFDDADWGGWFVWQSFESLFSFDDATGNLGVNNTSLRYQVDSKAMRKVSDGETIVMMAESQTGALVIAMHIRMLLLLS